MKSYLQYAGDMLRFRFRHKTLGEVTNPGYQVSWLVCDRVISSLPEIKRKVIESVFTSKTDDFPATIKSVSDMFGVHPNDVWRWVRETSKKIARERGL